MKISNSNIQMQSSRAYEQGGAKSATKVTEGMKSTQSFKFNADSFDSILGQAGGDLLSGGYNRFGMSEIDALKSIATPEESHLKLRNELLEQIMKRFVSAGFSADSLAGSFGFSGMNYTYTQLDYYETEQTDFSAQGLAKTEDGREISFDVSISMSRSFMQYSSVNIGSFANALMDPLMVNVGSMVTSVSDKKFYFDLDADGEKEYVNMPTAGSGFLALDLNGDGVINDGSELFGTRSGDGFKDLAKYDSDGNGWIDENDEIFDKLKVWYKNDDGTDELVDLKTADIGAIFLGEQATDFSLTSSFSVTAQIRSTGIFLKESTGEVGTIQHVDLATSKSKEEYENKEENSDMDGAINISYAAGENEPVTAVYNDIKSDESDDDEVIRSRRENRIDEAKLRRERREKYRRDREAAIQRRAEQKKTIDALYEKQRQRRADEKERIQKADEEHIENLREWREKVRVS